MPHHYTSNTVSVSVWCQVCRKETMHRVDDKRRGPCLECLAERTRKAALRRLCEKQPQPKQGDLFQ
jgi:ribosomal protein L44E